MEPLLFTLNESARQLSVSTRTVRRMMERGELPWVRIGRAIRIPAKSLKKWVDINMSSEHNYSCAGNVQGGKSTCHTNAKIVPFGGLVTSTQAAKELGDLLAQRHTRKPKH